MPITSLVPGGGYVIETLTGAQMVPGVGYVNEQAAVTNYALTCNAGSYALTGSSATISKGRSLTTQVGSYAVTGSSATLVKGRALALTSGGYVVNGSSAILTIGAALQNYELICTQGVFNLTGATVGITRSHNILANSGTFVVSGNSVNVSHNRAITASAGTYGVVGSTVQITMGYLYPPVEFVASGVIYGPGGMYTGTLEVIDKSLKLDLTTGRLVKPLNNKTVMSL